MGNMMRIHIGELAVPNQVFRKKTLDYHPIRLKYADWFHPMRDHFNKMKKSCATLTIKNGGLVSVKHPETGIIEPIYANILNSPIQFLGPHLFDHMEALQSNLALQASYAKRGKNNSSIDPVTTCNY